MAKELGLQGSVYEVKEQNALEWIKERLTVMEARGEIEEQQMRLKEKTLSSLESPKAVKGLEMTTNPRTFEKDLTITVPTDIKGPRGEIIQKAGTKLNPLARLISKKSLIFLDGADERQLQWALREYQKREGLAKLVLVNGPVLELMRTHEIPFYFDQAGRLVQYFSIQQIPAIVSQKKDKLHIAEVKVE